MKGDFKMKKFQKDYEEYLRREMEYSTPWCKPMTYEEYCIMRKEANEIDAELLMKKVMN